MTRGHRARGAIQALLLTLAAALALAGCGVINGLEGDSGVSATIAVRPGQVADFTAFLTNQSGATITLQSATLDGIHGFRKPRLVWVAVATNAGAVAAARGWPPPVSTVPLRGYKVHNGDQVNVIFGFEGDKVGEYAAHGLELSVTGSGATQQVELVSRAGVCVQDSQGGSCAQNLGNAIAHPTT